MSPLVLLVTPLVRGLHNYYTNVLGADILRNVIVSEYDAFYQINKFFANILFFHY